MKRVLSSFLLFSILVGCRSQQFAPIRYSNSILNPVYDSTKSESSTLNSWLQPYRAQLSAALDSQLFISCRTAGKKQPQSAIGNHLTEVMKEYATSELNATVDAAMLNYGGIRAALPRGSVKIRHIFEIMPFDNALCVVEMDSMQMLTFAQYWMSSKGHPIYGFTVSQDFQNRPYVVWKNPLTRYPVKMVVTDYVANGGDNASFFKTITTRKCLKTPLRDALIQYYRSHYQPNDTLCLPQD